MGEFFPLGTLVVNVSGSFLVGFFAAFTDSEGPFLVPPRCRQFFMIGVCGGYTTCSSFSLRHGSHSGGEAKAFLNTLRRASAASRQYGWGRVLALVILPK